MLKPQRKITRKEIKRDPFLETIDKIEYNFEQNRKTYLYIALGLIAVIISVNVLLNKQGQKDIDSNLIYLSNININLKNKKKSESQFYVVKNLNELKFVVKKILNN